MNTTVHGCQVKQQQEKKKSCESHEIQRSELITKFDERYPLPKPRHGSWERAGPLPWEG